MNIELNPLIIRKSKDHSLKKKKSFKQNSFNVWPALSCSGQVGAGDPVFYDLSSQSNMGLLHTYTGDKTSGDAKIYEMLILINLRRWLDRLG